MKKAKLLVYAGITLFALFYLFAEAITINPLYFEGAFFWCVLITVYLGAWALFRFGEFIPESLQGGVKTFAFQTTSKFPRWTKILLVAPWVFILVMSLFSSVLFSWKAYRDQLGDPQAQTFSSDMQMMDLSQIPIVDQDLAYKLADKKLGERPSLGSQVVLGEPVIQQVNGRLVWVVPLHHSGLFKWITNMEGTPGYVVVSATNVNDVEYVDNFKIKYHPNSYLLHDLTRHIRLSGGLLQGVTDYSFELDEQGQPYWIATTYRNTRGFALPEATGVYAINASTGAMTQYTIDNLPDWIDRVQPEAFIRAQITNKGEYVHGFLNFSDKDKYRPSEGQTIIYNNGRCYLFTGITSVGKDESAIGFMMVDMVTKQPYLYQMNGATEKSAEASAEGKVQHLGYDATFPKILNVNGQPTYFMTLKDREGLIKQYAFVSVSNYSLVGVGETIQEALRDFETVLQNSGMGGSLDNATGELKTASGEVIRISSEFNGNETVYKMILTGWEDHIFIAVSSLSDELALTQPGDPVTVSYYESSSPIVSASQFDNTLFTQK